MSQFCSILALSSESSINFIYKLGSETIIPISESYYKIDTAQGLHKGLFENVVHSKDSIKCQVKIDTLKQGRPA